MNISLANVVILMGAGVLIYAAVKDVDPRDVIKATLAGESPNPGKAVGKSNKPNPFGQKVTQPSAPVVSV